MYCHFRKTSLHEWKHTFWSRWHTTDSPGPKRCAIPTETSGPHVAGHLTTYLLMDKFKPPSNFSPLFLSCSPSVTLLPEIFSSPNNLFLSDTFHVNIFNLIQAVKLWSAPNRTVVKKTLAFVSVSTALVILIKTPI
jgi:hypothetical protein